MANNWLSKSFGSRMATRHPLGPDGALPTSSAAILAETFERHWIQLREIAGPNTTVPTSDDVLAILNLLEQMTKLLEMELLAESEQRDPVSYEDIIPPPGNSNRPFGNASMSDPSPSSSGPSSLSSMPCLDILLSENVLAHTLATSRMPVSPEHQDLMRFQQLKLYEALLGGSSERARSLLGNHSFLKPLLDLLHQFAKCHLADDAVEDVARTICDNRKPKIQTVVGDTISAQTETHLVSLLNQLCSRLMEKDNGQLLEVFFNAGSHNEDQFPIFSILVGFLHRGGAVGQNARDALLLCMSLSKKHQKVGKHIATNTNFCPLLATGLNGLYSLLPRTLDGHPFKDPNWYRLSQDDINQIPELENFLASLQFCDAVVQVAHPSVRQYLLGLIYMGFLVPVLGPALTQTLEAELICSTAYVELFLRKINEPSLLAVFLRYIFTDICDDKSIIDTLIARIGINSQLCTVTLSLFETLVGLNCEDVMLWLVFRHLVPMNFLLPSQKSTINRPDLHGRASEKFLSLVPICCIEASISNGSSPPSSLNTSFNSSINGSSIPAQSFTSPSSRSTASSQSTSVSLPTFLVGMGRPSVQDGQIIQEAPKSDHVPELMTSNPGNTEYHQYLVDARNAVRQRHEATKCWLYAYDGLSPPATSMIVRSNSLAAVCDDISTAKGPVSLTDEENKDFWKLMGSESDEKSQEDFDDADPCVEALVLTKEHFNQQPDTSLEVHNNSLGAFLDLLLEKVELMPTNVFSTNLLITGIISQLASYPQPLLRSVLIHPDVVLQPTIRGLFTAISSLRQKLDIIMPTFPGSEEAIIMARKFLTDRITPQSKRKDSNVSLMSTISQIGHDARATKNSISAAFSSMFRRKHTTTTSSPSNSLQDSPMSERTIRNISSEAKQYAMAAVLLEEWLHELAAIAHEQSVLQREQAYKVGLGLETNLKALQLTGQGENQNFSGDGNANTMVVEVLTESHAPVESSA